MDQQKINTFKCHVVILISIIIHNMNFQDNYGLKFFQLLIELIIVPAFDIIDELLESFSYMLEMNNGEFCDYLLNFSNCLFEDFQNALEEIQENSQNEKTSDLVDEIKYIIKKQSPRSYEMIYSDG